MLAQSAEVGAFSDAHGSVKLVLILLERSMKLVLIMVERSMKLVLIMVERSMKLVLIMVKRSMKLVLIMVERSAAQSNTIPALESSQECYEWPAFGKKSNN